MEANRVVRGVPPATEAWGFGLYLAKRPKTGNNLLGRDVARVQGTARAGVAARVIDAAAFRLKSAPVTANRAAGNTILG
ncbi:unnamed protein product, partial [Iphiclides podalirius]